MNKTKVLVTLTAMLAFGGQALAASETWLVTEENIAGIKGSQGKWIVEVDGGKLNGVAEMQADNGAQFTYKLEGSIAGGVYTVAMNGRSDGKKGCVWSGHAPVVGATQKSGLLGYASCEGSKLVIRASIFGQ